MRTQFWGAVDAIKREDDLQWGISKGLCKADGQYLSLPSSYCNTHLYFVLRRFNLISI